MTAHDIVWFIWMAIVGILWLGGLLGARWNFRDK